MSGDVADAVRPVPMSASSSTQAEIWDVVVVGGGVAGLTAAHTLAAGGLRPLVLESAPRCGGYLAPGWLRDDASTRAVRVDVGAESFAVRSRPVVELIAELGLRTVEPSGLSAWAGGAAGVFPLPRTGVLGIPGHVWAADTRRAIGLLGALRAGLDRVLPARRVDFSNLAALVRSRLGRRVLDRLVTPVAGGVHSSDPELLAVDSVAPGLRAAYERTGSLAAAVRALRAQAPAGSAVRGIDGGMNQLVSALERSVAAHGELRTGTAVTSIERRTADEDAQPHDAAPAAATPADVHAPAAPAPLWTVRTASGDLLRTPRLVLATTARDSLHLLTAAPPRPAAEVGTFGRVRQSEVPNSTESPELAGEGEGEGRDGERGLVSGVGEGVMPDGTDIRLVTLLLRNHALDGAPRGTGILVAPGGAATAKASTHATAKWPWLHAAVTDVFGDGHHVLRLSYGRASPGRAAPGVAGPPTADDGVPVTDAGLVEQAVRDVRVLYDVEVTDADVVASLVTRWDDALPSPTPAYRDAVGGLVAQVGAMPGLAVTGAWVAGTGLAAVVPHARKIANDLLAKQ